MDRAPDAQAAVRRVGFLGPAGTFSEQALLASAAPREVEPVGLPSIYETVMALVRGEVDFSIVPIENSLDGSISVTLDLLAKDDSVLTIVSETMLRVSHSLIATEQVPLGEIEGVLSHPQVPGQCTRFLREELPQARVLAAGSTAEAVRTVIEKGERSLAALGTTLAAEIYGGTVLRDGVEDRLDNETRFVWLARSGERERAPLAEIEDEDAGREHWKSSIVFWGAGAGHAGWLVRCLDEFALREINLTKIESRPRRLEMGDYMFFVDLAGGQHEQKVQEALAGLRERCEQVRVLGSYRAAAGRA
jgi:prephenate dehydratase